MIIFRKRDIDFLEKDFSKFEDLESIFRVGCNRICLEIMKCLEMFESGALMHWLIEKIEAQVIEEVKTNLDIKYPVLLSLAVNGGNLLNNSQIRLIVKDSLLLKSLDTTYKTSKEYISSIKNTLLTECRGGEVKYKNHFDRFGFKYSIEEYCDFYKYIALCLSGQLDPRVDEFDWNIEKVIRPMKVLYNIESNQRPVKIIAQCIYNISRRYDSSITFSSIGFGKLLF